MVFVWRLYGCTKDQLGGVLTWTRARSMGVLPQHSANTFTLDAAGVCVQLSAGQVLLSSAWNPVWIYEGALLFLTAISCNYRDSPYEGDWRRAMTEGPRLSRPVAQSAAEAGSVTVQVGTRRSTNCPGRKPPCLVFKRTPHP
jgi:hypothetical protein